MQGHPLTTWSVNNLCFEFECCPTCGAMLPYEELERHLDTHVTLTPIEEPILSKEPMSVTVKARKKTSL